MRRREIIAALRRSADTALAVLSLVFILAQAAWAADVPANGGRVTDLAHVLSATQVEEIAAKLKRIEEAHRDRAQVVVLTIPKIPDGDIETFANDLFRAWKPGAAGKDNGIAIIIATDGKLRIEVGYGLEGAIPDSTAKRITSTLMVPKLSARDYAGAISAAVDEIGKLIGTEQATVETPSGSGSTGPWWLLGLLIVILFTVWAFIVHARSQARIRRHARDLDERRIHNTARAMMDRDFENERARRRSAMGAGAVAGAAAGYAATRRAPPLKKAVEEPRRRRDDDDSGSVIAGAVLGGILGSSSGSSSSPSSNSFSSGGGDSGGGGASDSFSSDSGGSDSGGGGDGGGGGGSD